jgi:hypothetical protein
MVIPHSCSTMAAAEGATESAASAGHKAVGAQEAAQDRTADPDSDSV